MPNSFLYVLKEVHSDKKHQAIKNSLRDLAEWDGIQLLNEGLLYERSNPKKNSWGIESEGSFLMAIWCRNVHYDIRIPLSQKVLPEKLTQQRERLAVKLRLAIAAVEGGIPNEDRNLADTYLNSNALDITSEEKLFVQRYVYFRRNQDLADNIKKIIGQVHSQSKRDRVFALSIGSGHVELSEKVVVPEKFASVRDLPTILGRKDLVVSNGQAAIEFGSSLQTVVDKALELASGIDNMALYFKTKVLL